MACKQIFAQRIPASSTVTVSISAAGDNAWRGSGDTVGFWLAAGAFKNFTWKRPTAPGGVTAVTYTLKHNGVDVVTLTITGASTSASDTSTVVTVAPGDTLTWVRSLTGSPASSDDLYTAEFWGTVAGESGHAGLDALTSATLRSSPFKVDALTTAVGGFHADIVAAAGALSGHAFKVASAPGTGNSWTGHYYKNGVKQDGTGGTVDTGATCADLATSATWTGTLSVSPGDEVYLEYVPSGTPSTTSVGICTKFTATTDGESHASGFELSGASTSTLYYSPAQDNANGSATEGLRTVDVVTSSFTLRDLYARIHVSAGTPATVNMTVRKNSAATALTAGCTNVVGSNLVDEVSFASGDTWTMEYAPTGGVGTSPAPKWSVVMFAISYTHVTACQPGSINITGTDMDSLVSTGLSLSLNFVNIQNIIEEEGRRALRLDYSLSGAWRADAPIYDTSFAATPGLDDVFQVVYFGQRIFKGNVVTIRNTPRAATATGHVTHCLAKSNRISTDQIEVTKEYAAGQTLKAIVTDLFNTYIAPNFSGYVLDPSMLAGPTITETVTFEATRLQEAFFRLMDITGWVIRITPNDVLESFEPGTKTASYSLTAANGLALGPVTWERTRSGFVNRVNVRYGEGVRELTKTFTATAGQTAFVLDVAGVGDNLRGYFLINAISTPMGPGTNYLYNPATLTLTWSVAATGGEAVSITYDAIYPATVTAEDAASIAAVGLFERTYTETTVFLKAEAAELAAGYLRGGLSDPQIVTVRTKQKPMPFPGDVIPLSFVDRGVPTDDYLLTRIEGTDYKIDGLEFVLTCVSGTEAQRHWTEILKSRIGG